MAYIVPAFQDPHPIQKSEAPESPPDNAVGGGETVPAPPKQEPAAGAAVHNATEEGAAKRNETEKKGVDLDLVRVPLSMSAKRETAIMRLTNRIKALEINVSLSSR